ncbi:MAG: hypothetical protein WCF18_02020 [Chthoniobacteraceae bacterium]
MTSSYQGPSLAIPNFIKHAALSVVTAAALMTFAPSAHAGTSELKALVGKLPPGVSIQNASSQQLIDAFVAVLQDPALKFNDPKKQGVVAGELLKAAGPNATNVGDLFASQIVAATTEPLLSIFGDRRNFVALAASTAGAGKGLNVSQIPGLTSALFSSELGTTFTTVALATKSKDGQGAIFGGRARQIFAAGGTPVDDSVVLANSAIFDKKLAGAAQSITQWIAAEFALNGADSAAFTVRVADGNGAANNKLVTQIVTGSSAGDPTNAGNIVHNVFNQQVLLPNGTLAAGGATPSNTLITAAIKGAGTLVKTVSAVADIEAIQQVGNALGKLIGTVNTAKPTTGLLSVSKAAGYVKTLATAIINKPRTNSFGVTIARNADVNKSDEIVEVAAYMVGGLMTSPEFNVAGLDANKTAALAKKAAASFLGIIKSAVGVKPKIVLKVAQGPAQTEFAADVAASVALTVLNSPTLDPAIKQAFKDLLLLTDTKGVHKTAVSIFKTSATQIFDRLTDVYAGTNLNRFEDGNDPIGAVSDPETDKHPFS